MDKIRNVDRQESVRRYPLTVVNPGSAGKIVEIGSQQKVNMERWKRKENVVTQILNYVLLTNVSGG